MSQAPEPRYAPLTEVLEVAAVQMEDVAARCCRLQDVLGPLLHEQGHVLDAQALDLVTQRLAALALFFGALSQRLPEDLKVNSAAAAQQIPLADLASMLSLEPLLPAAATAGELDLFG